MAVHKAQKKVRKTPVKRKAPKMTPAKKKAKPGTGVKTKYVPQKKSPKRKAVMTPAKRKITK